MVIAETCPDCGAERISWMGGSHFIYQCNHGNVNHRKCCDQEPVVTPKTSLLGSIVDGIVERVPRIWTVS